MIKILFDHMFSLTSIFIHLTIVEPPTFDVTQLDAQEACNLFSQLLVAVSAEDQHMILQLLHNLLAEIGIVVVEHV